MDAPDHLWMAVEGCFGLTLKLVGRPAWVWYVSALRFTNFLIDGCMISGEAVLGLKIRVSDVGGSFNPCARPFGPFDQTDVQSMAQGQCKHVTSLLD